MTGLEDLQFTTGQGPCQDAYASGLPVHASHLGGDAARRWPMFVELAQASGVHAVFAYPLMMQRSRVGVTKLYHDFDGNLRAAQHDDSLVAEILSEAVLSCKPVLPTGCSPPSWTTSLPISQKSSRQPGMVSVQLGVSVAEAMLRIWAHAFAKDRAIDTVAGDVVARRMRFDDDHRKDQ